MLRLIFKIFLFILVNYLENFLYLMNSIFCCSIYYNFNVHFLKCNGWNFPNPYNNNNNTIQSANKIVHQIESRDVRHTFKWYNINSYCCWYSSWSICICTLFMLIKMFYNLFRNPLMYIFNILRVEITYTCTHTELCIHGKLNWLVKLIKHLPINSKHK